MHLLHPPPRSAPALVWDKLIWEKKTTKKSITILMKETKIKMSSLSLTLKPGNKISLWLYGRQPVKVFKILNGRLSYIISKFNKNRKILAKLNYHMSIKTSQAILKCFTVDLKSSVWFTLGSEDETVFCDT